MKTNWLSIALFEDEQNGKSLDAFLRAKRVDSRTYHDTSLQVILFLAPPQVLYHVQVRQPIYKMTVDLLGADQPAILSKALHCPACGSLRVSYPHLGRNSPWATFSANFGIIFRLSKHQAYCENCHHLWPLSKPAGTVMSDPVPHHAD